MKKILHKLHPKFRIEKNFPPTLKRETQLLAIHKAYHNQIKNPKKMKITMKKILNKINDINIC